MAKTVIPYEDFLMAVSADCQGYANEISGCLLQNGCAIKIESAKSGYVVSYVHAKSKKVVANFVFRKGGLIIRIYGDHVGSYIDLIERMPAGMKKNIDKAPACKRLLDPEKCNSRCPMGYDFIADGNHYQKCRYNSFMFAVNAENTSAIIAMLERELAQRAS